MNITSKGAVIIEPREHPALQTVLKNVRNKLPNWPIIFIHGTKNEEWAKRQIVGISDVTLKNCNVPNSSITAYSNYLTSISFWETLPFEKILLL